MKNRLLFFALLYSLLSFAQQRTEIVLNWVDNATTTVGNKAVIIPVFQNEYMSYDVSLRQLSFSTVFPVSGAVNTTSLQVSNIVYESITAAQLGQLSASKIPSTEKPVLSGYKAREQWFGSLSLSPIVKDGSGYKRVKSFSYTYSLGQASSARSGMAANVITNSVLASGEWYRFYVEKSGVYRLNRSFLSSLGFNVNTDPRKIKIYGNGGRMLPLLNSIEYPADLQENAVRFIGENDGNFDNDDYILFYAEGVDNWNSESDTNNNLFADRTYYYVTSAGSGNGKRIIDAAQPTGAPTLQTSSFDAYYFHEQDLISIARLGRKWHGEQFNVDNVQDFEFNLPDAEGSYTISINAAANSIVPTNMEVKANGGVVGSLSFGSNTDDTVAARDSDFTGAFTPAATTTISLTYNNGGNPASNAWLDRINIEGKRALRGGNGQFRFRLKETANNLGVVQYNFSSAAGIDEVWDITDIYNARSIDNNGQASFSFKGNMGSLRQYIAVVASDYYTPLKESQSKVANQNLKGTIFNNAQGEFQDLDYLIVTPENLRSSAETLANLHRTEDGLTVKVVALENIYQEFSSGKQDIAAIRNLVKYIYSNASTPDKRIKYVNLFGDGSFDYKDRIPNNTNIVPTFHGYDLSGTRNYSIITTFVTDDFFGLMDDSEGEMRFPVPGFPVSDGLDIAMGRMLVSSKSQADEMVNKVAEYKHADSYGRWRNEFVVVSDDLDGNGSLGFQSVLEQTVTDLRNNRPFVNVRKIYLDSYEQQASSGGQRYPDAEDELKRAINYGALVVNYFGHGGEDGLASERVFKISDVAELTNRYKYPLFITATCELTKFDNPYRQTAGEYLYWNPTGGAIGMITTTRELFISSANTFNPMINRKLFAFDSAEYPSMAEALRQTKYQINDSNIRMICYIGDPALKLAVPKPKIVLTHINDAPVTGTTDVLQSLAYAKLGGRVTNENNTLMSNYNGVLEVTVFDKPINKVTLDNDNMGQVTPFQTLGETIFRGNATVTNGQFEFGFVVPRDIRVPVAEGRVSFYSKKNNVLEDHTGFDAVLKIGGVNLNAEEDNTPPTTKLYMNDESFVSGGITNSSPILIAQLFDAHGINTASGIGHDIIGILDGDETNQFLMNDYYEANIDDHTTGTVRFPFTNLAEGLHTLTFKAWDVYNNLVTAEIQFVVTGDDELKLERVLNYPNPFVSYTEFWFSHNRPFELLDVQVQIFTVTGKIVKTINQSVTTDGFLCREIKWDGRDDFGDKIGKGVYVYKLTVRSSTTNKRAEKYEKLVLL